MNRKDFQVLAECRAREAGLLARRGEGRGAYYLAGLAVECALKACIARKTKRYEFPPPVNEVRDLYSHDLKQLLKKAGLSAQLELDMKADRELSANWGTVQRWSIESRYDSSRLNGRDMHTAVSGPNGVLLWIKRHW